jgi:hypothetical protein
MIYISCCVCVCFFLYRNKADDYDMNDKSELSRDFYKNYDKIMNDRYEQENAMNYEDEYDDTYDDNMDAGEADDDPESLLIK